VTIQNAHPASSAKYGVLTDALLALYVQSAEVPDGAARALRTHAPAFAVGVDQIAYSGSYPLSRLRVIDDSLALEPTLYAYSRLIPSDEAASAVPAVAFTLTVRNPSAQPARAALFFNLPFGAINDCARVTPGSQRGAAAGSAVECMHMCADPARACAAWSFNGSFCFTEPAVPHSVFRAGWHCGVAGQLSAAADALTLHATPAGAADSAAAGNLSLVASSEGARATSISFAIADDPALLYQSFAAGQGQLVPSTGLHVGSFGPTVAAHGAVAVAVDLDGGAEAAVTIVLTWFFPERDHMGVNVGNYYANMGGSSLDFAWFAEPHELVKTLTAINSLHRVLSNEDTSYPGWLQDHMVNQLSHFRGMMFLRDGRMREYEAPDCPDIDSIHNDYQRHLPYIWLFPRFELSKIARWAQGQQPAGFLYEDLGSFGLGPLDKWGDRIMADTTSLWVVEQWELFLNTNNSAYMLQNLPTVRRAVDWMVANANTNAQGLPWRLVCTYDIINFDQYNATTFNSFIYLAALRAAQELGSAAGDRALVERCDEAIHTGQTQLRALLWNETYSYFRAYTGGNAIMGDCLYGQMLAHHLGLGWLADPAMVAAHLAAELRFNGDPHGIKVVTGRHTPPPLDARTPHTRAGLSDDMPVTLTPPRTWSRRLEQGWDRMVALSQQSGIDTQDDVIWLGAAPDWSYLQIAVAGKSGPWNASALTAALAPAAAQLTHYRDTLRDLWNIVGIIGAADWPGDDLLRSMPYVTSHYGFVMTDYYLLPLLAGQQVDMPHGRLSFAPVYPCPFSVPLLLVNTTGIVACDKNNVLSVEIAFGMLRLPAGGLSVSGRTYRDAVNLSPGQRVTWS
jgi:non-lysosomal glucosylceramidase